MGKGPSFNVKEGPKSGKSKWYYADKEKGPKFVDTEIFFLSIGFVCSEMSLEVQEHLRQKVQIIPYIHVAFNNVLKYFCIGVHI